MTTDKPLGKGPANEDNVLGRFYGVIPAGGVGTRLWPLSRAAAPKFLHDLTGSGSTLIRATYSRLEPLCGDRTMVVTGTAHRKAVLAQLPELTKNNLVLESEPKDSAAAIGLAAAILYHRDPRIIMGSFAADQVINPVEKFQDAVREAIILRPRATSSRSGSRPRIRRPGSGTSARTGTWASGARRTRSG